MSNFKKQGFLIDLDNFGKGESTIKSIIEIEPNIVKIDRYFAKNLSNSSKNKQ
ncbi:EAL domain-containing protein [Bacillus sp. V3B]|uniref:EAL domain-containing protein n=1 Tax=Bacillus sp. V3B TaxID=2804915 RepID=UPI0035C73832